MPSLVYPPESAMTQQPHPTISVVIPSFNCDATLPVTLNSLMAQTRRADEIIIVDDHSANPVETLLAGRYSGVRVLRHEVNRGVQNARNTGFREARGEYLLFLDADDILCPEFLERTADALRTHPAAGACFTGFYKCFDGDAAPILEAHKESGEAATRLRTGEGLTFYLNNTGAFIPSFTLFRKAALDDLVVAGRLYSAELESNEDFHLFVRLLAKNDALYLKAPLGIYFLRPESLSRNQIKMWRSRAAATASLVANAGPNFLTGHHVAYLERMRASAVRQYARLLDNGGERGAARLSLWQELKKAPSLKTFVLLLLITAGLQKKKIKYGGAEY